MGLIDSKGNEKIYSIKEMQEIARKARAYILTAICAANSGHPGGSLSSIDLMIALYFNLMKHKPSDPFWSERDRFILSKAHVAPALYAALGLAGYYPIEEIALLRKLGSPFQGHIDRIKAGKYGVETSGGSLGQGLGIALGVALALKLKGSNARVFCMMGDGEQQEGSIWEAAMAAGNSKLNNLIGIIDKNGLQIDGEVCKVMDIDPIIEKYKAFNWHVIEVNGHDFNDILKGFNEAFKVKGKPIMIIAHTIKGKGISFMENVAGWHGKAPKKEEWLKGIQELGFKAEEFEFLFEKAKKYSEKIEKELNESMPKFKENYWWNSSNKMKVEMEPTRFGFGKALKEFGGNEKIVTLRADISESIRISDFSKDFPEREKRVFSVGIAEQNMMQVAAGLAKEGFIPWTGTYGVFASGRPWDQIRTTICYGNFNVKIGGAHGGISVGPDGATHQSLEEFSLMQILPRMTLASGCDSIETFKLTKQLTFDVIGPCYLRFGREAVPIVTKNETPCVLGKANIIRFRKETERFVDAFDFFVSDEYKNENEDITLIAVGSMVAEAMRAAYILKKEFGIKTRIINMHTLKPLDKKAIIRAGNETKVIITIEEHQVGGFGNLIASTLLNENIKLNHFSMIGVQDTFGESGEPWQLMKKFKLTAEFIVERVVKVLKK